MWHKRKYNFLLYRWDIIISATKNSQQTAIISQNSVFLVCTKLGVRLIWVLFIQISGGSYIRWKMVAWLEWRGEKIWWQITSILQFINKPTIFYIRQEDEKGSKDCVF